MKKYLHIGYPKNFSTSLQRNYFSKHSDLYHLGIGVNSNVGYIDNLTSSLFEVYLKSAKEFKYAEQYEKLKSHISFHYNQAIEQNKKCFGASSEHFSFGFTYESLDFNTKFLRAVDLFGKNDLNIIIVLRNQVDLIKSLYRESVRVGLPGKFNEYLYNLYKFQDRNYLYDLRYDLIYSYLLKVLPKENIHFIFFENMRDENKQMIKKNGKVHLIDKISNILGVGYLDVNFKHFNEALTDMEIIEKSQLNKSKRHDLGREMLFSAEIHRQSIYFNSELNLNESEKLIYQDVLTKRDLINDIRSSITNNNKVITNLYSCDKSISKKIVEFYKKGNLVFSEMLNIDLPNSYFNNEF